MHTFKHLSIKRHLYHTAGHDTYLAAPREVPEGYDVLLKLFTPERVRPAATSADWQRLAERLQGLRHAAIVPVLELGVELSRDEKKQETPYVIRAYLQRGSLRDYLAQHLASSISLEVALATVVQIGRAVAFAHERRLVHRNIRPENILLDTRGGVLLADFGLDDVLRPMKADKAAQQGILSYQAPEQMNGLAVPASDQYALGCLLCELLMGLQRNSATDQVRMAHIEAIMLRALAMEPELRYPDVDTFLSELQSLSPQELPDLPFADLFEREQEQPLSSPEPSTDMPYRAHALPTFISSSGWTNPLHRLMLADGQEDVFILPAHNDDESDLAKDAPTAKAKQLKQPEQIDASPAEKRARQGSGAAGQRALYSYYGEAWDGISIGASADASTEKTDAADVYEFQREDDTTAPLDVEEPTPTAPMKRNRSASATSSEKDGQTPVAPLKRDRPTPASPPERDEPVSAASSKKDGPAAGSFSRKETPLSQPGKDHSITHMLSGHRRWLLPLGALVVVGIVGLLLFYFRYQRSSGMSQYAQAVSGTPGYTSAMNGPDSADWSVTADNGQGCNYANGGYQVTVSTKSAYVPCMANNLQQGNFAFQVEMTVFGSSGDGGGVIFRRTSTSEYRFRLSSNGSYDLVTPAQKLVSGTSTAIHTGTGQVNVITVVAQGTDITIYVNMQVLVSIDDHSSSSGSFGLFALESTHPTSVLFKNIKLWP